MDDLMENEAKEEFVRVYRTAPSMADLPQIGFGSIVQFIADFSSCKTTKDQVLLKYAPTKISAPDLPLERMTNLRLQGRYPMQLYEEFQRARNPNP